MDDDEAAFFTRRPTRKALQANALKRKRSAPNGKAIPTVLAEEVPSDSDSDVQVPEIPDVASSLADAEGSDAAVEADGDSDGTKIYEPANGHTNNVLGRDRSLSLTPPPEISAHTIAQGKLMIANTFAKYIHPEPLPTKYTLSSDPVSDVARQDEHANTASADLDSRIRRNLLAREASHDAKAHSLRSPSFETDTPVQPSAKLTIVIMGIYVADTPQSKALPTAKEWEEPIAMIIRQDMKFGLIREQLCKARNVQKAGFNNVILTYRGMRIFDYTTPNQLGIGADDMIQLEAHTKDGFEIVRKSRTLASAAPPILPSPSSGATVTSVPDSTHTPPILEDINQTTPTPDPEPGGKMIITLRSQTNSTRFEVRSTTSIAKMIAGYRQKQAVPAGQRIILSFEGDKIDDRGTVGDTDIENGDLIDVKIL